MKKLETAVQEASETWMNWEGIEAIGQGKTPRGKDCILVLCSGDSAALAKKLPDKFQGFKVVIQPSGIIHAQD